MVKQTKLGAVEVLSGKDSGHIFEVVIDGLGIEFGEKRRVHDDSKIFDLSIWENWIAICWDGKLGREDQKFNYAQVKFEIPFRHPRRDAKWAFGLNLRVVNI